MDQVCLCVFFLGGTYIFTLTQTYIFPFGLCGCLLKDWLHSLTNTAPCIKLPHRTTYCRLLMLTAYTGYYRERNRHHGSDSMHTTMKTFPIVYWCHFSVKSSLQTYKQALSFKMTNIMHTVHYVGQTGL